MKRRELIAPMTLEAVIATRYPYRWSSDATLTSRMVYDGALTLATAQLLADGETTEDELLCMLLGWTTEQWQWAKANEGEAWKAMIDRDMVYSVDRTLADRMTKPSPVTAVLHPEAPGRMGTYIGVQIARSWLARHAGTTPIELLDSECYNAGSLLVESKYAPAAGRR
jgi:hypothetical protein